MRHPNGFIGGPSGYVESETAKAPIIAEDEMTDEQTIFGESIRESDLEYQRHCEEEADTEETNQDDEDQE